jgi:hypothetical protein
MNNPGFASNIFKVSDLLKHVNSSDTARCNDLYNILF